MHIFQEATGGYDYPFNIFQMSSKPSNRILTSPAHILIHTWSCLNTYWWSSWLLYFKVILPHRSDLWAPKNQRKAIVKLKAKIQSSLFLLLQHPAYIPATRAPKDCEPYLSGLPDFSRKDSWKLSQKQNLTGIQRLYPTDLFLRNSALSSTAVLKHMTQPPLPRSSLTSSWEGQLFQPIVDTFHHCH